MGESRLNELLARHHLDGLSNENSLALLAEVIDLGSELGREDAIAHAITLAEVFREQHPSPKEEALLLYFLGNAWDARRRLQTATNNGRWAWDLPAINEEILAYRRALKHPAFPELDRLRRCQTLTNLGNVMSSLGRFVEALEYFDRALREDKNFGMAHANRAACVMAYAGALYDPGQQIVFAAEAARALERAVALPLEPGFGQYFSNLLDRARNASASSRFVNISALRDFSLGSSAEEIRFRRWVLEERLFLNPLNDLGVYEVAGRDVIHLPTMRVDAEIATGFHGFMNQLKQEYAFARTLLFESRNSDGDFTDRELGLIDTLDGTIFGARAERSKIAFRSAYSILDKVSVFVSLYFRLGDEKVSFRDVWFVKRDQKKGVQPCFAGRANWPLRGLYWLAKDLYEDDPAFQSAMTPEAQATATMRNRLEHRYVKVYREGAGTVFAPSADPFAYKIEERELEARASRMLKLARAALLYLALAVHVEESQNPRPDGPGVARGTLPNIE